MKQETPLYVKLSQVCAICGDTYEYEVLKSDADKGTISVDEMPDGYYIPNTQKRCFEWICDLCGSCPECGKSLEKEPEKRATKTTETKICSDCQKTKGKPEPKKCVYGVKQMEALEDDYCFDCEHKMVKDKNLSCTGGFK